LTHDPTDPARVSPEADDDRLAARLDALDQALVESRRVAREADRRAAKLEGEIRTLHRLLGRGDRETTEAVATRTTAALPVPTSGPGGRFAVLYPAFQDRFRGSEAEITRRLRAYLPDVDGLVRSGGVVDVGPGRGEWLALLNERSVPAYGVDSNEALARSCRARGLEVLVGNGIEHLHGLTPGSVDMVTAFHVIEHLQIEELLALIEGARLALRPGGCLLLETPNPTNLMMGACDFYCDPTHLSPLPPALTEFLVEAHGFVDIQVRHLHPRQYPRGVSAAALERMGEVIPQALVQLLARSLFGPQDYAVLGYAPSSAEQSDRFQSATPVTPTSGES
jgi:2-polyprenyl-3-methyl-5-hydroxy-6-metoxy-1,4-benzoquinol methylase